MVIIRLIMLTLCLGLSYSLYPILLIPGDIASHLHVRYIKAPPHLICGQQNQWFLLWLNLKYFFSLKVMQDCLIQTMKLDYDPKSRSTFSPDFCEIQVPGFGTVDTIKYVTKYKLEFAEYYEAIIKDLEKNFGYTANKNILGAPYDFRKAPNETGHYLKNLKRLIENMSKDAEGRPVIIIAHSMGGLHLVKLLNEMSEEWKEKYIKTFISISAPYSGSVKAVKAVLSGLQFSVPWFRPDTLKPLLNTWPSSYYLFPFPKDWSKDVIVSTKEKNFTADILKTLLTLSTIKHAPEHYEDVVTYMKMAEPPNVTIHCIYSSHIPTVKLMDYSAVKFPEDEPKVFYGEGDGSVNEESLKKCGAWKGRQSHPVEEHVISNVNHLGILTDHRTLDIIREIIKTTLSSKAEQPFQP